jgi:hypothetical protein
MTAAAIARITIAAISRGQTIVEPRLIGGEADVRGVIGRPDLERVDALGRWLEQFGKGRDRAVVQIRRCRPNPLEEISGLAPMRTGGCWNAKPTLWADTMFLLRC